MGQHHRGVTARRLAWTTGFAGFAALLVLLVPVTTAATSTPVSFARLTKGGTMTGHGVLAYCTPGLTSLTTGWVCSRAVVTHGVGYARGWDQLQGNVQLSNLSGPHSFWGVGALNLSTGYAQVRVSCLGSGDAYARVYVFWHVWVYDRTVGAYVDQLNSGYIWDSGDYFCPFGGGSLVVSSPKMVGAFNSSTYGLFSMDFTAGHTYLFTFFLGCTAEASVSLSTPSDPAAAGAFCNIPSKAASNTFSLDTVEVG